MTTANTSRKFYFKPSDVRRQVQSNLEAEMRRAAVAHYLDAGRGGMAKTPHGQLDFSRALRLPRAQWERLVAVYQRALAQGQNPTDALAPKHGEAWITDQL